jgi:hypothetical protein
LLDEILVVVTRGNAHTPYSYAARAAVPPPTTILSRFFAREPPRPNSRARRSNANARCWNTTPSSRAIVAPDLAAFFIFTTYAYAARFTAVARHAHCAPSVDVSARWTIARATRVHRSTTPSEPSGVVDGSTFSTSREGSSSRDRSRAVAVGFVVVDDVVAREGAARARAKSASSVF